QVYSRFHLSLNTPPPHGFIGANLRILSISREPVGRFRRGITTFGPPPFPHLPLVHPLHHVHDEGHKGIPKVGRYPAAFVLSLLTPQRFPYLITPPSLLSLYSPRCSLDSIGFHPVSDGTVS